MHEPERHLKLKIVFGVLLFIIAGGLAILAYILLNQTKAIESAKNYQPASYKICAEVLTRAVDIKTGAKYTFPNSCLPDGWKKI